MKCTGTGTTAADKPLQTLEYELHEPGDHDVVIDVHYCGVCHSDIHKVRNEWAGSVYPLVPGHEATGLVKSVGSKVTKFKAGDKVGVSVVVSSCRACASCKNDEEVLCSKKVLTYNDKYENGTRTYGGYGKIMVVNENFVLDFAKLDLAKGAPILCAGITVYTAIKEYHLDKPGTRVGVLGLGGLGHMAVLILKAMGVEPVVVSRTPAKKEDALKMGAVEFILSTDAAQMEKAADTLDGIVDTISAMKDWTPYMGLMKTKAALVTVGLPPSNTPSLIFPMCLINGHKKVAGAGVSGLKMTQECLDFCAEKNVYPWIQMVTGDKMNEAFDLTVKSEVRYRFVLDVKNSH